MKLGRQCNYHKGLAALRHYFTLREPSFSLCFKLYSTLLLALGYVGAGPIRGQHRVTWRRINQWELRVSRSTLFLLLRYLGTLSPSVNMHQLWTRSSRFNKLGPIQTAMNRYDSVFWHEDTASTEGNQSKMDAYRTGLLNVYLNIEIWILTSKSMRHEICSNTVTK